MDDNQSMGANQPMDENQQLPTKPTEKKTSKSKSVKKVLSAIIVIALLLLAAGAGYYWGDKQAKDTSDKTLTEKELLIKQLQDDKTKLEAELAAAKDSTSETETVTTCPSDTLTANIKDAVQSQNYAALEGYMADTVNVILAASEGLGPRTPTEAVADMNYLSGGTGTWDFTLPAEELSSYAAGFYTTYFPADAYVGKAANNYLVSFTFDTDCKISGVFITGQTDILL